MGVKLIGRILIIEFTERNSSAFEEIVDVLKKHTDFEYLRLKDEPIVSLPGLEIYPDRRKIYCDRREINLTTKEYEILTFLVENKGRVLTYNQIYQKVWGEEGFGSENNTVGCQVRNLREKLYEAESDAPFSIRCVREVGYCFEVNSEEKDAT